MLQRPGIEKLECTTGRAIPLLPVFKSPAAACSLSGTTAGLPPNRLPPLDRRGLLPHPAAGPRSRWHSAPCTWQRSLFSPTWVLSAPPSSATRTWRRPTSSGRCGFLALFPSMEASK